MRMCRSLQDGHRYKRRSCISKVGVWLPVAEKHLQEGVCLSPKTAISSRRIPGFRKRLTSIRRDQMQFVLTLKLRNDAVATHEEIAALQELIGMELSNGEVCRREISRDGVCVFIATADPAATFERLKPLLYRRNYLKGLTATYRHVDGELTEVLWPAWKRRVARLCGFATIGARIELALYCLLGFATAWGLGANLGLGFPGALLGGLIFGLVIWVAVRAI
jgi:hypothetical protein